MKDIKKFLSNSRGKIEQYKDYIVEAMHIDGAEQITIPEDVYTGKIKNRFYDWAGIFEKTEEAYALVLKAAQELFNLGPSWVSETLEHEKCHTDRTKLIYEKNGQGVDCFYGLRFVKKNDGGKEIVPVSRRRSHNPNFVLPIEDEIAITEAPHNYLSESDVEESYYLKSKL